MDKASPPVTNNRSRQPITESLKVLDQKVLEINESRDGIVSFRAEELDFIGRNMEFTAFSGGRPFIHEGNIKFDLKVIDYLIGLRGLHNWKHAIIGFRVLYNFTPGQLKSKIETAPEEIVELFNFRGTLGRTEVWRRFPEDKKMLLGSCDFIINAWFHGTAPISYIQGQYRDLWCQMCDRIKAVNDQ